MKVFVKDAQLEFASYASDSYTFSFADTERRELVIKDSNSVAVELQDSIDSTVDVAVGDVVKLTIGGTVTSYFVRGIEKDASGKP